MIEVIASKFAASPAFCALGLEYRNTVRRAPTRAIGETFVLTFSNDSNRELQVIVLPQPNSGHVLLANVVDTHSQETFGIHNWMKAHGVFDEQVNRFALSSYPGDFDQQVDAFVAYLGSIMQMNAMDSILRGTSWEEIHFDWAGMR